MNGDKIRIHNRLLDAWAQQHWSLEAGIRREIEGLDDKKAQNLSVAVNSLTMTNCWFATYEIAPIVKSALFERAKARAESATSESRKAVEGKESA